MGGSNSKPEQDGDQTLSPEEILEENTHCPSPDSPYPFFVVQLSETEELPYKGQYVSDIIADYISKNRVTHLLLQTHGWNTPPDKAIAVPFSEFMAGMQNDVAMPEASDDFCPLWVGFTWPALPLSFFTAEDALTRAQLIEENEQQNGDPESDIAKAAHAVCASAEAGDEENEQVRLEMQNLAAASKYDDDDDDEDPEEFVQRVIDEESEREPGNPLRRAVGSIFTTIVHPMENLMFGRLMARGKRTGNVLEPIVAKFMNAAENRMKVTLMANSLGAHVLCGILHKPNDLPYKLHSVFFVQGAISRDWFAPDGKYAHVVNAVAGPIVCTFSDNDLLLKNVFDPFHGDPLGVQGVEDSVLHEMKPLEEVEGDPYVLHNGVWNSVDGTNFIDEGNAVSGGHGDFKEDETTTLYWACVTAEVDDDAYDL